MRCAGRYDERQTTWSAAEARTGSEHWATSASRTFPLLINNRVNDHGLDQPAISGRGAYQRTGETLVRSDGSARAKRNGRAAAFIVMA